MHLGVAQGAARAPDDAPCAELRGDCPHAGAGAAECTGSQEHGLLGVVTYGPSIPTAPR
jgi:hypothetical protein